MNPSTALATVLVDELVRGGVREAVLSPGSRSAPLALALHAADASGRLRLHVRIDERSAGFHALGLAKVSDSPVPVVTTSGTAAANLLPAVAEAAHTGVPLVALTADRPPELRGVGANQTIDQVKLFGAAVRTFHEVGAPDRREGQNAYWRSLVCRSLAAGRGLTGAPGPVHLNLALRDPLLPDPDPDWVEALDGRPGGAAWTHVPPGPPPPDVADDLPDRTLVVVGDVRPGTAKAALLLAEARAWPVLSEPSGNARSGPDAITTGDLLLSAPLPDRLRPDRVLVVGRPTLSRQIRGLLARCSVDVVANRQGWVDQASTAGRVLAGVPALGRRARDTGWVDGWRHAEEAARRAVDAVLEGGAGLSEQRLASELVAAIPADSLLVAGSSMPVRHLFLARGREEVTVVANRGAAGIDGTVSTAVGAALAWQSGGGGHAYALVGDLTLLHDASGLVLGPDEPRPDLTVVVLNNDGGAIFGLLEQGAPEHAVAFERVFGTPHGVDLAALSRATGTTYIRVSTPDQLRTALEPAAGVRVVEVPADRSATTDLHRRLRAAVADALRG